VVLVSLKSAVQTPPPSTQFTGIGRDVGNRTVWKTGRASATIELADMASLSDFEKMLPTLSPGEKAQILKWVVQELGGAFPGIDSRADVCGGDPCIVRTRIPVWVLEQARRSGATEQELLAAYPSLRAEDLVNAWAYARAHATEIEAQIRENEAT
jgi:uncharacterized protein (DUF433 family)